MEWVFLFIGLGIVCLIAYLVTYSKDTGEVQQRTNEQSAKFSTDILNISSGC